MRAQPQGLHWIDWTLIVLYFVSTILLGIYFKRKQQSTGEFFLGNSNMNPLLIGVSLFASTLSTITYLGLPGEIMGKGPMSLASILMYPLIYVVVAHFLLPVYMRQRVTSAYELLETRLGLPSRLLAASIFLLMRLIWMTMLVYLSAKALVWMIGVSPHWTPLVVVAIGVASVTYTSLGGMRAVVITDLMQTLLLYGGALLVLAMVTYDYGGLGWFPTSWQDHWDDQPLFSFDPGVRATLLSVLLVAFVTHVTGAGADQISVQRFMSTSNLAAARRAIAAQILVAMVVTMTLVCVGFAVMSYFQKHNHQLPANMTLEQNADELYPHYIAFHLPVGLSGLVVAAMLAAAMSSIDSGVHSMTAVVTTDFLRRFGRGPKTERGHVRTAQLLTVLIGIVVVLFGSSIRLIEGNIAEVTGKALGSLLPSVFALFILALFVPFARPAGAFIGCLCGCGMGMALAFSGPLLALLWRWFDVDPALFGSQFITRVDTVSGAEWTTVDDPVSFQWVASSALSIALGVGLSTSWLQARFLRK